MDLKMKVYLIIDAGGTFLKWAVLQEDGTVLPGSAFMIRSHSSGTQDQVLGAFEQTIKQGIIFVSAGKMELGGIGIAIPGPFDCRKGISLMKHKFKSIYGLELGNVFRQIVPEGGEMEIKFVHDANAVLAGELWKGTAQKFSNAAVITLGTGLGFSFSQQGMIQCNELGGPRESIFGIPFGEGILEDYVSQKGLLRIYRSLIGERETARFHAADLGKWADDGDKMSIRAFEKMGRILGLAIKDLLMNKKIECLLFGGQISRSFVHMEKTLRKTLKNVESLTEIAPVSSIEQAALWGVMNIMQRTKIHSHAIKKCR